MSVLPLDLHRDLRDSARPTLLSGATSEEALRVPNFQAPLLVWESATCS